MMTRGGEGGKKCPKFDDVMCERPLIKPRVAFKRVLKVREDILEMNKNGDDAYFYL